jgi:hypothetical protein
VKSQRRSPLALCAALCFGATALLGCSKPQRSLPPPHALEDASAAAQRASEAMKADTHPGAAEAQVAKPSEGGADPEKTKLGQ